MTDRTTTSTYQDLFTVDQQAPRLDGTRGRYVNFDNAASTPPLRAVEAAVRSFMPWYSSVHRGTGFKSQLATHAYERARAITLGFVGADPATHVCIFGKNTTEAINKLARRFPFREGRDLVLVSMMEHHSNDLPYRAAARVVHVAVKPSGELDEDDFDRKLEQYAGQVALVSISGASNVTGFINPAHRLAEKAHAAGAQILVDAAQLAPHRAVAVGDLADPAHFDYVALSAHKLYAPYGTGALIGRRDTFEQGAPDLSGGGTIEIVTEDSVEWSAPPEREEAGSPNVVGAVALAAAIKQLQAVGMAAVAAADTQRHEVGMAAVAAADTQRHEVGMAAVAAADTQRHEVGMAAVAAADTQRHEVGMAAVAAHEAELTAYALERLNGLARVELLGDRDPARARERLGVIPFNISGVPHFLTAAILGYEFGIGVRNGCFCAHPYILHLLGLTPEQTNRVRDEMLAHDRSEMPGLVRASFGLYNTLEEVDVFVSALEKIAAGKYRGRYHQVKASGEYVPEGWEPKFSEYFAL